MVQTFYNSEINQQLRCVELAYSLESVKQVGETPTRSSYYEYSKESVLIYWAAVSGVTEKCALELCQGYFHCSVFCYVQVVFYSGIVRIQLPTDHCGLHLFQFGLSGYSFPAPPVLPPPSPNARYTNTLISLSESFLMNRAKSQILESHNNHQWIRQS